MSCFSSPRSRVISSFPWHSSIFYIENTHCNTQTNKLLQSQPRNQLCWVCNICIGLHCTSIDHARVIYSTLLVPRGSCFHSMQLVPIVIPSVANGHAKFNAVGTLGLPILMEAHVLEGVGSATVLDIIPEQDSITASPASSSITTGPPPSPCFSMISFPPGCKETRRVHG